LREWLACARRAVDPRGLLVIPYLDHVITSPSHKSPHSRRTWFTANQTPWYHRWRPAHSIYSRPMCMEYLMRPVSLLEFQHRNLTIRAGAGEKTAGFVWRPGHDVDRGCVEREAGNDLPGGGRAGCMCGGGSRFAPDFHGPVVGR